MSYQIEIRHLKYFLAVAEELHFRKAADKLFISQPGLSKQIKQMEDDLDLKLFERHNRKVELTSAGIYLKKEIARNLNDLERILNHSKQLNDGVEGHLNLGYVGSAMQQLIPNLLLKFKKEHPNIIFDLKEMDNQRQVNDLLSKTIDIGFLRLETVSKNLEVLPVLKENFCLVLPKNHEINTSNFRSIKQLKNEPFIMFDPSYSTAYHEKIMQIFDDNGFTPIISHNTINASSIYRLVENNLGVSIVPKSLQTGYNMNVKFIELDTINQKTVLSAVWNKDNKNPILKRMIHIIKSEIV